jgi:hypothetical protein
VYPAVHTQPKLPKSLLDLIFDHKKKREEKVRKSSCYPIQIYNKEVDTTCYIHPLPQTNKTTNQFSLGTVAEDKVTNIINDLKSKNSSGFDNVSNKLLKKNSPIIIDPLTKAMKASLTEGTFPQILKLDKLQPIFKNGDECMPDNYSMSTG